MKTQKEKIGDAVRQFFNEEYVESGNRGGMIGEPGSADEEVNFDGIFRISALADAVLRALANDASPPSASPIR